MQMGMTSIFHLFMELQSLKALTINLSNHFIKKFWVMKSSNHSLIEKYVNIEQVANLLQVYSKYIYTYIYKHIAFSKFSNKRGT